MIIKPDDKCLQYCGRIDFSDAQAPEFVYPCSSIGVKVSGTSIKVIVTNKRAYWNNYLGYIIDGEQGKIQLPLTEEKTVLTLAEGLEDRLHEVLIFKRQDSCHTFRFYGLEIEEGAEAQCPAPMPDRRIEVYGDSVSAGEVSEAVDYTGKEDPVHEGEYSNSYYSYAWMTARKLKAQIHDIAQGGIALLHATGWFMEPDYIGLEETYDKLQYQPVLGPSRQWDFDRYRPHVVIVAIGQNDSHPDDYMALDYDGEKGRCWREHYKSFVHRLREVYPDAVIILATTLLNHDAAWDRAIGEVCSQLQEKDAKVYHHMYRRNGCGTPGHLRISEAEEMAQELAEFIEGLGEEIWQDEKRSYAVDVSKGIVNDGSHARLLACMKRAEQGEELTIGFIGGSITQGSLSSTPRTCYAYRVFEWWQNSFPKAQLHYVNAGIGGTTSQFGAARVQEDLLDKKPDVVFVEFSVNDENNEHFAETYEGLVRRIYKDGNRPAVLLIHNICYDTGVSAQQWHSRIGKHYDLPCISMKSTIYAAVEDGSIPAKAITPDNLHPNDTGHKLVAEVIEYFLNQVREEAEHSSWKEGEKEALQIPEPLTLNEYEDCVRYQNDNCNPVCEGFVPDTKKTESIFRKGWTASCINDKIVLEIKCTGISIQYRKSVQGPAPVARVTVDGDEENARLLNGKFDEDWGDCLYIDTIAERLEDKVHTVEITIVEGEEVAVPFYLVSVIGSR